MPHGSETISSVVLLGSIIIGVAILCYRFFRDRQSDGGRVWVPVGKLDAINIYPLKSGAPTTIQRARCRNLGLSYYFTSDRMFVVYDNQGRVVTARTAPKLLKIQVIPTSAYNVVRFISLSGRDFFDIDISNITPYTIPISMKFPTTDYEMLETRDCGDEAAAWISSEIDTPGVRLGFWPSEFDRDITKARSREVRVFKICNEIAGAYSNMSSFLLLNTASVDDLVSRLGPDTTVGTPNFRANIIISDAEPYAEDHWRKLKIGKATFRIIKPCVRCSMVNINPKTLVADPNNEPIRTLKKYRQLTNPEERNIEGDSPMMGCYMGIVTPGEIKVGDIVYALERTSR